MKIFRTVKSWINSLSRTQLIVAGLALATISTLGFVIPNQFNIGKAVNEVCANAPTDGRPHLNIFPVDWDGSNDPIQNSDGSFTCRDYPALVSKNLTQNDKYPKSQQEFNQGLTARSGDEILVRVYIHNNAPTTADPATATARNVQLTSSFTNSGITTSFGGSNTNTVSRTEPVHLASGESLMVVPGSGIVQKYNGQTIASNLTLGNNTYNLGDIRGCFEYSLFVFYKLKVVSATPPATGQLTLTKQVRNVTLGGSFADQVTARTNDNLEYRITVGAQTANVANATVTDTGATGISMTSGSLRLNGQTISGNINSGILLSSVTTSATQTITYSARVSSTQCNAQLVNTARVTSATTQPVSDTATVTVQCNQQPNPVICNPSTQTVDINQNANFTATGGNSTYSWTANGGTPTSNTGSSFTTRYATSGTKTVIVTSGNQSDSCVVVVRPAVVEPNLVCTPGTQTVDINQYANFTASGGNSVYSWTATGGNPSSNNGSTFTTRYATSGTKTVTVRSNNQTANCTVIVRPASVTPTLVCNPSTQTVDINQNANFTATGGNGTYSWTANGGNPTSNTGSSFTTRYATSGTKTVIVTSGNQSDSCVVVVRQIIISGEPRLSISKSVRNITQGISFRNSVNANTNDRVEFEVIVTSTGTETASNVVLTDYFPSELWLDTNSVRVDNSYRSVSSNNFSISLGSMSANQQKRITFEATVNPNYTVTIRNLARASSSNTSSVEDDAYVFVTTTTIPGNPNIIRSKKVTNERTGQAGTSVSAQREDFLIYSLSTTNNGNGVSNGFVISDDLSGILPYADIVDLNGGTLNGNVITYPSLNLAVGETVIKTFRVRVKYHLAQNQSYSLQNTYGNLVTVTIGGGTTFVAPKTGSSATSAAVFAGLLTSGFVAYRKRRQIMSFIYV